MAENSSYVVPESIEIRSEDEERREELYPNAVECKNIAAENYDAKDEKTTSEERGEDDHCNEEIRLDREQRLQTQTQPQVQQTDTQADRKVDASPDHVLDSAFNNQRVYKKSSPNNKLTLYLASRDLIVNEDKIDKLQGVLLVDPDYLQEKRIFGQVTLTFRYGREDEEVMGLKFCNEAVMCLAQLYPPFAGSDHQENTTPLQEALVKRLGPNAHAFTMEITPLAPPSVQLVPAKEYNGAPIGTSYDVRAYIAERADEKLHRKSTVRMGIRVIQRTIRPPLPSTTMYSVPPFQVPSIGSRRQASKTRMEIENEIIEEAENVGPHAAVEKPFLLSDGRVGLEARLDRAIYAHGDSITVHINVNNNSSKSVRRIKVFVVQHVDVCMFSNGKFKNVVALVSSQEDCPVGPGGILKKAYTLRPIKGSTKNWIALEDSYTKTGATLASTVVSPGNAPDDRNVFAIYVSYYVKVKLLISAMGGEVSLKLPFALMHTNADPDLVSGFPSPIREQPKKFEKSTNEVTERSGKPDSNSHRNKDKKLEAIKEQEKESRVTDVDLIEHCEESDST